MPTRPSASPSPSSYRISKAAPPSLSPLAVRSSSTTRIQSSTHGHHQYEGEYLPWPTTTTNTNDGIRRKQNGNNDWRTESLDRLSRIEQKELQATSTSASSKKKKGKSRAVAFVVGTNSSGSGEEGGDESEPDEINEEELLDQQVYRRETGVDDFIKWQIHQPIQTINPLDLDSLLTLGIGDYTYVLSSSSLLNSPSSSLNQSLGSPASSTSTSTSTASSSTSSKPSRVSLGKGKFSEVLLATKGGIEYALKHTPLHPHHPLIATRLLREPTILAQLKPHPNLVKVFETIRTPGHFYLVEENLKSSITLESLVSTSKTGILDSSLAWEILEQLASVVRSLHEPLRVCHRDIKPENILVRILPIEEEEGSPTTSSSPRVVLKLLDFGLATHYSSSEAKLTTCCGSPAYHSPELWRGLREPSGTVRYWGPEVDIWCLGLTLLRCLTPNKYPLGISHSSLNALSDKVVDALLSVEDEKLRRTLAGLMHMNGTKRMKAFETFCLGLEEEEEVRLPSSSSTAELEKEATATTTVQSGGGMTEEEGVNSPSVPLVKKEFKTTTFVPTELRHALDLPLLISRTTGGIRSLESVANGIGSRSPSRTRTANSSRATSRTPRYRAGGGGDSSVLSSTQPSPAFDYKNLPPMLPPPSTAPSSALPSPELTPDLSTNWATLHDSLPSTPVTPFNHPSESHLPYPTPIELYLLNPTDEPIRRATSYIKYALRCAGILYHVREDVSESGFSHLNIPIVMQVESFSSMTSFNGAAAVGGGGGGTNSSGSTLNSAIESPLPTPTSPTRPLYQQQQQQQLSGEELEDPTDFITYLQCVIQLPDPELIPSKASSALIAALKPSMIRAHSTPPIGKYATTTTNNGNGKTGNGSSTNSSSSSSKKKDVKALVFFLSITKAPPSRSRSRSGISHQSRSNTTTNTTKSNIVVDEEEGSATPKPGSGGTETRRRSRRRKSGEKIIITFSDERAVDTVREALKGDTSSTLVEDVTSSSLLAGEREGRRGRMSRTTSTLGLSTSSNSTTPTITTTTSTPPVKKPASSTSRSRNSRGIDLGSRANRTSSPVGSGLGMSMGPPVEKKVNSGFFEFAFGRFPGLGAGGRTQSAGNLVTRKLEEGNGEALVKEEEGVSHDRSQAAAIAMGAMF